MRKLLLFGLLAAIFGSAFALEHLFTRPANGPEIPPNKARFVVGGGAPRAVPEESLQVLDDDPVAPPPVNAKAKSAGASGAGPQPAGRSDRPDSPVPGPQDPARAGDTPRFHDVAAKETLWTIAAAELGSGTRYKELASWNGLTADAPLQVGTRLRLAPPAAAADKAAAATPPPKKEKDAASERTHKLAKGESLSKLAARYLGDANRWREIQSLNKIADPANVPVGSVIKIPQQ